MKNHQSKNLSLHMSIIWEVFKRSSNDDEEERVYNLISWGPILDPDPETPVEPYIKLQSKKMPRVKKVKSKIIVK